MLPYGNAAVVVAMESEIIKRYAKFCLNHVLNLTKERRIRSVGFLYVTKVREGKRWRSSIA
jgi:hypothetical protein